MLALQPEELNKALAKELSPFFPSVKKLEVAVSLNKKQTEIIKNVATLAGISVLTNKKKLSSKTTLVIKAAQKNKLPEFLKIVVHLKAYQNVWFTKDSVSRGGVVAKHLLVKKNIDTFTIHGKPFVFGSGRYVFTDNLDKNQPLSYWQVKRSPDVLKGDKLTAEVRAEDVVLKITVTSLQSGFIGDRILIKFPSGKKQRGRMKNETTVTITI